MEEGYALLQLQPKNFKSLLGGKTEILRYAQDDQNTVGSKGETFLPIMSLRAAFARSLQY